MSRTWNDGTISYLLNRTSCPRCDYLLSQPDWCSNCGAELAGETATELAAASVAAADALGRRQAIIERLSTRVAPATVSVPTVPLAPVPMPVAPSQQRQDDSDGSKMGVQSVLAVAGAALLAVAAIVFTFLNPDLTDFTTRTTIVGGVTALFLVGAALLARRRLQFSAEAVGALGVVFVGLDVWAFGQSSPRGVSDWIFVGLGTVVSAIVLIVLSRVLHVRGWLWFGITGLSVSPAFFGYAAGNTWVAVIGHLAVGFVALGLVPVGRGISARLGGSSAASSITATVVQLLVLAVVAVQLLVLTADGASAILTAAALLALSVLSGLSALTTASRLPRFWTFSAGFLFVAVFAVLVFALPHAAGSVFVLLAPSAAGASLLLLTLTRRVRRIRSISTGALYAGGWAVALIAVVPAIGFAAVGFITVGARILRPADGLFAIGGLAAVSAAGIAVSWLGSGLGSARLSAAAWPRWLAASAAWAGVLALLSLTAWSGLPVLLNAAVALLIALTLSFLALWSPLARLRRSFGLPLTVGAHLGLIMIAVLGWTISTPALTVAVNAVAVAALLLVARTVSERWRPLHLALGFAYALIVFAYALSQADLEVIAVLCLTTAAASVVALVATLVKSIGARYWYAVLIVTVIPFLIGIISVLIVRSGWTALSTAVTFALAGTLVLTRRSGLNRVVRSMAAALLVPALAVVIICLGAQFLSVSGSPIALPIIAIVVAATIAALNGIQSMLGGRGVPPADARLARVWIEISCMVTASLAVLLALVRAAAGLDTALAVLAILGLGGIAGALITRRRYLWVFAGICWSGALWCFWAILGVGVLEAYVAPPAIAAAIVAALLTGRGMRVLPLFWLGLSFAAIPSLVLVAVHGTGEQGAGIWRIAALLLGSLLLLSLGRGLSSNGATGRYVALRGPALVFGMATAGAGAIQAVRFGLVIDATGVSQAQWLMLPVLGISAFAAALAAAAAFVLGRGEGTFDTPSRWRYAAAILYLVAGPITAIRPGWFPILTLGLLTLALLTMMLVTVWVARNRRVGLPPVWFLFTVAWCTAVADWSPRVLRVESFSIPLGVALLAAGVIVLLRPGAFRPERAGATSWPIGFSGSWRLLTPGILVTIVPSVIATGTDPLTWRAILVIAVALAAILLGSLRRLAAPFVLGIIVLPVENIIVFVVQIGRTIGANPWWITLATAGAVLLVIAVSYERRAATGRGGGSRIRDLT